ncbi:MAG: hypothetical protein AAF446_02705, partial [Pseudomonadota bacterium]
MNTPTILQRIIGTKRAEIEQRRRAVPLVELQCTIETLPEPRDFHAALAERAARKQAAVIAEFKRLGWKGGAPGRKRSDKAYVRKVFALWGELKRT